MTVITVGTEVTVVAVVLLAVLVVAARLLAAVTSPHPSTYYVIVAFSAR